MQLKFLNDLYSIDNIHEEGNKIVAGVILNPDHEIFKGHFPGNPILPGVCMMQIIKELLIFHTGRSFQLCKAGSIKYLSFVNPQINGRINLDIERTDMEENRETCNVTVSFGPTVFCRFKGEFSQVS